MKSKLQISINPTYKCNLNCPFCYLKHNSKIMDLDKLETKLTEISLKYDIDSIDLYGGEICLLPDDYLMKLILICKKYVDIIGVITNYTIDKKWLFDRNDIDLSVSWDYIFRDKNEEVLERIKNTKRELGIIMTSPELYDKKYEIADILNKLDGNYYIDIKPCMPSENNNCKCDLKKYQEFVLFMISNIRHKVLNQYYLDNPPNNLKTPHIFINPDCEVEKLKFNKNCEYFEKTNNYDIELDDKCKNCQYFDDCQTEHDSYLEDEYDCLGMKHLIEINNKKKNCQIQNWRKRRLLSYLKNKNFFGDENLQYSHMDMDNEQLFKTIMFFFENESELLYPAKSYYVAIVYAWLLNKYFGEDIKVALNYDDLLNYDDKFFVKYEDNKELYDKLLKNVIEKLNNGEYNKSIQKTVGYFNKEFIINE